MLLTPKYSQTLRSLIYLISFSVNRIPREFSCFPRCLNISHLRRCNRLDFMKPYFWGFPAFGPRSDFTESTSFSVNIPIVLGGIFITGKEGEEYTVTLKLNDKFVSEGCFLSEERLDGKNGFYIIFKQYHLVNPDLPCILEASIKGERFSYGRQSKKKLVAEKVTFRFAGPAIQSEDICIAEILFRHLKST